MSADHESDDEVGENYYTFLNLPKDATADQINAAYRKQSRIYHPDKHINPESKKNAELLFNRTKRAYEVLSDPHKRAIYDSVGEKGLHTDGWELVQRTKTPAEIREEYERLAQAAEERKLQQRTNPRGNVTINVNATEIFQPYDESELPHIEISSMSISQSIEAPITRKDMLIMSGNLYSSNGTGSGGFMVCGRRLVNKGWLQLDLGAGNGLLVGAKGGRTLTSVLTLNGGTTFNFRENGILPAFFTSLAVQLDKFTVGTLTVNGGSQSSMTTQIDRSTEENGFTVAFVIGTPHLYLNLAYTRKMVEREMKLRLATKIGTFGFMAEYGAEKKVSKYSSVFASVSIGVPTGVILKFKIIRSNQTYVFPIHLSEEIIPASVFYATITPALVWFLVKKMIIDPINEENKNMKREKTKRTNEQKMAMKKQEANAAVELMKYTYDRIVMEENNKNGLIIHKATYGTLNTIDGEFIPDSSIDVKVPLQCLVKSGSLLLYNASKSDLPGFYDPCIGEEKHLRIEYSCNNRHYNVTFQDKEEIRLPLREQS